MRAFLAGLMLVFALGSALPAAAFDAESEARYQALLAAAKGAGDQPVDWQALRFAYADSAEFDLYGLRSDATRKAMFQALNSSDYKGAIAAAKTILDQDY